MLNSPVSASEVERIKILKGNLQPMEEKTPHCSFSWPCYAVLVVFSPTQYQSFMSNQAAVQLEIITCESKD